MAKINKVAHGLAFRGKLFGKNVLTLTDNACNEIWICNVIFTVLENLFYNIFQNFEFLLGF